MVARLAALFLLVAVATPATAGSRSASFGITVRVVRPLPVATPPGATTAFVAATPAVSLPCGTTGSPSCDAAVARTGATGPVVVTSFPDGAPTAVLER